MKKVTIGFLTIGLGISLACSSTLAQGQEAIDKPEPTAQQSASTQAPRTLGEIRAVLLNQEIMIVGSKMRGLRGQYQGQDVFLSWCMGEPTKYGCQLENAPYTLHGARGTIKAVQIAESYLQARPGGVDAFGEQRSEDAMVNPYIHVVARLHDGMSIFTTGYYITIVGAYGQLILADQADRAKQTILPQMDALVGKRIYTIGYSQVLAADTPLTEVIDLLSHLKNRLSDIPNLTPLTITKVRYVDSLEGVIAKVEFLGNRAGIVLLRPNKEMKSVWKPGTSLLQKLTAAGFLPEIPSDLSLREIEAIKNGTIFRTMSKRALYYSWGFPAKENDWGRGGKQYVYGQQYVYVQSEKVTDWQSIAQ